MKSSNKIIAALLGLTLAVVTATAQADQLADIKARGTLVCGVLANFEPFGFQDPASREIVGYDVDYCKGVAKALGVKPVLQVVSMEARIPELLQGRRCARRRARLLSGSRGTARIYASVLRSQAGHCSKDRWPVQSAGRSQRQARQHNQRLQQYRHHGSGHAERAARQL